ncbi:MAG: 5'-nucleotidase, lipoprotein e(P4) family [Mucilaginibacter sp.]|nr:5'-nucleotidase, lipoprotein e(P4) family [Mucilaginibacter sp.]
MKKLYWLALALASPTVLIMACKQGNQPTIKNGKATLLPEGPAWGALYQQRAGEYKALCYQAYNIATLRLEQYVKRPSNLPKAIITDIDETVLDNSPYFVDRAKQGLTYSDSSWIAWTAQLKCDTLPGAAHFLKRAKELGVAVYYVTNRFAPERLATLENLKKFDLPDTDDAHLFVMGDDGSSKEGRRMNITKDHNVILFLGDNLGDFNKEFDERNPQIRSAKVGVNANSFGEHFIVFPNVMYGSWEDRLYKKGDTTNDQKNNRLNNLLK